MARSSAAHRGDDALVLNVGTRSHFIRAVRDAIDADAIQQTRIGMDHPGRGFDVDLHQLVRGSIADQLLQQLFAVAGPDGVDQLVERLGKVDLRCSVIETDIGERLVDLVDVEVGRHHACTARIVGRHSSKVASGWCISLRVHPPGVQIV
jgi:hypothetical protein